jgi:hypothetical protein
MFSIGEDWISCFRINWRGNDFMKFFYDHTLFFDIVRSKEKNENILVFQPYVN